jgi:hypothetical protein
MPAIKNMLHALSVLPLCVVAGCGGEWETRPYEGVPYTEERTAGYGVEYVRARMAPAKGPVTEPTVVEETTTTVIEEAPPPPVEDTAPVTSGEEMFNHAQEK